MTLYIRGAGMNLARIEVDTFAGTYTRTYLHPDQLGSATAGTSQSGAVLWREQYAPYGDKLTAPAANDDLGSFTGHIDDDATTDMNLTYMQARYYDPGAGRFTSIDPVTFLDTMEPGMVNRYAYTMGDPVNNVDPDGEYRIGLEAEGKGVLISGGRVAFSISFDTESKQVSGSVTYGPRLGLDAKGSVTFFGEPSTTRANGLSVTASGSSNIEAGVQLFGNKVGLSSDLSVEGTIGSADGLTGNADLDSSIMPTFETNGLSSQESSGRIESSFGASLGGSAGLDTTVRGTVSLSSAIDAIKQTVSDIGREQE